MPRSHNPAAYPTVYYRMLDAFERSALPFHVHCSSPSEAVNKRNEWHSFIRALERTNQPINIARAQIGRSRKCYVSSHDASLLCWAARDLEDYATNLEANLEDFFSEIEELGDKLPPPSLAPGDIPDEENISNSDSSSMDEALGSFLAEDEETLSHADKLFDTFMQETAEAVDQQAKEKSLLGLLNQSVPPIKTKYSFSSEVEDPNDI